MFVGQAWIPWSDGYTRSVMIVGGNHSMPSRQHAKNLVAYIRVLVAK